MHLVLVVVLPAVRAVAVAAVGRAARGLDVGRRPGRGAERAQRRRRVEGAGADLHVVGLEDGAALRRPVALQAQDDLLEAPRGIARHGRLLWRSAARLARGRRGGQCGGAREGRVAADAGDGDARGTVPGAACARLTPRAADAALVGRSGAGEDGAEGGAVAGDDGVAARCGGRRGRPGGRRTRPRGRRGRRRRRSSRRGGRRRSGARG